MEKEKFSNRFTIAFYNLENYFDTTNDAYVLDDDFTPKGFKKWNEKKFYKKSNKLAKAIAHIGEGDSELPPVLLGIAEVENGSVIEKLLTTDELEDINYDYVHFDSPDERGIDTALIYHRDYFEVIAVETIPLLINSQNGNRDLTRDILYVKGKLNREEVHVFVNHWPSRRDGADQTAYKRIEAAKTILEKVGSLQAESSELNIILMGDFNDDPNSESIKTLMDSGLFINPMQKLLSPNSGSANYKGAWSLFDQVIFSHSFLNFERGTHSFKKAEVFSPEFLKEWKGKYKGNPFRTYAGKKYIGGYSDHFPVYIILKLNS
ncbi:endonuclease [Croceitalea rosinachiae]|uniref:Endonuclease n=1 Tax=Croceitalea rosinachiae TaxID=3075596 RepID=A0ABU3A7J5_9FLAO|nr:endonuclease [Croceitalea sp. F388]MDT0606142.1 endonuclease [Croceitalea sp. F388]